MVYRNRNDWWLVAAFFLGVAASLATAQFWIGVPMLVLFVLCVYPQKYEIADCGLRVRATLFHLEIPYGVITQAEPCTGKSLALALEGVAIRYGLGSELRISPADPGAFLADLASHAPHLKREGHGLVLALS